MSIGLALSGLTTIAGVGAAAPAAAAPAPAIAAAVADLPHPAQCTPEETRATERFWYFGVGGKIDFGTSGSTATPSFGTTDVVGEGSTVVTDTTGALQFWSNANTIFNRNGVAMQNGTGISGNNSAVQTVAAFPAGDKPGKYFVVATSADVATGPNGSLSYSIVDMTLNNGLGAVTSKNLPLGPANTASEALTAVPNAAGTGFWAVTQTNNSSNVLAYEFGGNGPVTGTPVVSTMSAGNGRNQGSIYFNADLTQAVSLGGSGGTGNLRVLDFNASTGQFFESLAWTLTGAATLYTADFSPAGDYIYVSEFATGSHLYRYRIADATTGAQVSATKQDLGTISSGQGGHVRRAPDGKMYVANNGSSTLSVVNAPDSATAPNFTRESFRLAPGAISRYGLPQMVTGCPPAVPTLKVEKTSTLTKDSRPGDQITYTVTATNSGTGAYTAEKPAVVLDDLSGVLDDATYNNDATAVASDASAVPAPSFQQPSLVAWSGPLAAGKSVAISYTVTLKGHGDGTVHNVAWQPVKPPIPGGPIPVAPKCDPRTTAGLDSITGEPCAVNEAILPKLSITKTADTTELPTDGGVVTYTVTVTNEGPGAYTATAPATMTDNLSEVLDDAEFGAITAPASGATFNADDQTLTWSGPLAAGASVDITYTVTYDASKGDHVLYNVACVPAAEAAGPGDGCVSVQVPGAAITMTKSVDPADNTPVVAGQNVTYTLSFENTGKAAATVNALDDLSNVLDDATIVDGSVTTSNPALVAALTGDQLAVTGSVPAGETYTVSYSVTVKVYAEQGDHTLGNVLSNGDGSCPSDGCPATSNDIRHLSVVKAATPNSGVHAGDVVAYTVTVVNDGTSEYTAEHPAQIADDMTGVLDDATYNGDAKAVASDGSEISAPSYAAPILGWSGPLDVGASVTITYTVTVTSLGDLSMRNTAGAVCSAPEVCDPPTEVVVLLPHVTPTKTSDPASGTTVEAGDVVTYTLSWTNTGLATGPVDSTDDLSGVLDDGTLTSEPVVDEAHADSVTAVRTGNSIRVTGVLAPGETTTVTYQVTIGADGKRGDNEAVNVLTPDVPPYLPPTDCAEGADCPSPFVPPTTVHEVPQLKAWKTVDPASGTPLIGGQEVTYTLHFTNTGKAAGDVNRVDDLSQVLDDATVTTAPASSDPALSVSEITADDRFAISGTVEPGASITVVYTVTVKAEGERGDSVLANFLLNPTAPPVTSPECVPAEGEDANCTTNPVGNLAVTKSVDPSSGTKVAAGQQLDYTLTFENTGKGAAKVDYTDVIAGVLDDAKVTAAPQASDAALTASAIADGAFTVTGELAAGQKVTVTYSVSVKAYAEQGDHTLGNFLVPTGTTPPTSCVEENPLCTVNRVIPPAAGGLASTGFGAELPIAGGIGLLLAGLVVLVIRRRNRNNQGQERDAAGLL